VPDGVEAKARAAPFALPQINISAYQLLLSGVLIAAFLTRFARLGTPGEFYFDETYFPRTAQEIYRGDPAAWQFYGHENTHPPLSKEFMAGSMAIFEFADDIAPPLVPGQGGVENAYAWRFFGALAGVGSVLFMYLLARKLFDSEIAGLAAAFILTCEGVVFAQSRIATPDTFVLFFMLGCVYFLVTDRFLFSGVFFGAALACKYVASLTAVPIVLYLVWKLITRLREQPREERMKWFEIALPAGIALLYTGLAFVLVGFLGRTPDTKPGLFDGLGAADYAGWLLVSMAGGSIVAGVAGLVKQRMQVGGTGTLLTPQGRTCLEIVLVVAIFFIIVPGSVFLSTYIPMLWHAEYRGGFLGIGSIIHLNRQAYDFHSNLDQPHPYSSTWDVWPIMGRPIFFYLKTGSDTEKIYSLGNPLIFWASLPALAFVLWRALRYVGARVDPSRVLLLWGRLPTRQAALLFVILSYLGLWLPWAIQQETGGRVLFIYHYLPALSFAILALAYTVDWLWRREEQWGKYLAGGYLLAVAVTFAYFYPHLSALDVPGWLERTYYWDWLSDLWPSGWLPGWLTDWLGIDRSPFNWH